MRVRFLIYSIDRAKQIDRRFIGIGKSLSRLFYKLKYDLGRADLDIDDSTYLTATFFSALAYFILAFLFILGLLYIKEGIFQQEHVLYSGAGAIAFYLFFFFLHLIYPGIMAKSYAAGIDRSLIFALKSMLIQISSGISLYDSMVNVSRAKYGTVSKEFKNVVQDISAGESEASALEKLALKTKSEHLKKTSWQLLSSLRSGASLEGALGSVVETLTNYQRRAIRNYASELNLWILMYLLFAAAIPTLGITFLVVLGALGGTVIEPMNIITIAVAAFLVQVVLIGFVKTRIPKGYL